MIPSPPYLKKLILKKKEKKRVLQCMAKKKGEVLCNSFKGYL
jgi:hypothetical protein